MASTFAQSDDNHCYYNNGKIDSKQQDLREIASQCRTYLAENIREWSMLRCEIKFMRAMINWGETFRKRQFCTNGWTHIRYFTISFYPNCFPFRFLQVPFPSSQSLYLLWMCIKSAIQFIRYPVLAVCMNEPEVILRRSALYGCE